MQSDKNLNKSKTMSVSNTIIITSSGAGASNLSISRANELRGNPPTALEFPSPQEGSGATIRLVDDSIEHWDYASGAWTLKFTDDDLSIIPEYNSMSAALLALGPDREFRYSELNIDGVSSPNGSTTAITRP